MYRAIITFKKVESNGSITHVTTMVNDDHFEVLIHLACAYFDIDGLGC
jgi:hypothetical protein